MAEESEKKEEQKTLESMFDELVTIVDDRLEEMNNHLSNIEAALVIILISFFIGLIILVLSFLGVTGAWRP